MLDAKFITEALQGRWYRFYGVALCPAHTNTRTPALSLSDGKDGRLLAHCHAGCTFVEILNALKGLGVLDGAGCYVPPDPATLLLRRAKERDDAKKRARQARALWDEAAPIDGSLAETYLRGRGITCPLPQTLRFHPACWHPTAARFPAMVARVDGADHFSVHRTYLQPDGSGKAKVLPDKAMLGSVAGGAVALTDAPSDLVVAEGIETALSLACGLLCAPATIWAALSTSGMRGLRLPSSPKRLIIATDGDHSGAGQTAGLVLAERANALGWDVSLFPAPEGRDWNDVLTENGGAK